MIIIVIIIMITIIILIIIIIMMMIIIILIIIVIVFIVISRIHTVKANSDGKKKKILQVFCGYLVFGNHKITTSLNTLGSTGGGLGGLNPPPWAAQKTNKKKGKKKEKKERKKNARWRETLSSANIVRRYSTHLVT